MMTFRCQPLSLVVITLAAILSASAVTGAEACPAPAPFVPLEDNQRPAISEGWKALKATLSEPDRIMLSSSSPVLVNFWAVWCPPCKKELPLLARLQSQFAIKAIHIGDNPSAVSATLDKLKVQSLGVTSLADFTLVRQLGFQGLPATLVAVNGTAQFQAAGYVYTDEPQLTDWLACLAEESHGENK